MRTLPASSDFLFRYLSLFWSPRRPIHVCRGRLRFPPLFTAAPVPIFYQLPSLVAAATHRALGAPVTFRTFLLFTSSRVKRDGLPRQPTDTRHASPRRCLLSNF